MIFPINAAFSILEPNSSIFCLQYMSGTGKKSSPKCQCVKLPLGRTNDQWMTVPFALDLRAKNKHTLESRIVSRRSKSLEGMLKRRQYWIKGTRSLNCLTLFPNLLLRFGHGGQSSTHICKNTLIKEHHSSLPNLGRSTQEGTDFSLHP